jgi:hypothetical protein
MENGSGPANVGVCEYSSNWTVLRQAHLMQDGGDIFQCVSGGGFEIGW